MPATPTLTARDAAGLLLDAQGLAADPRGPVTGERLRALVDRLGFVQLDSINAVARGHHLTLFARLDGYRSRMIDALYEERAAFEHWTHDASLIPIGRFPLWRPRFRRFATRLLENPWMARRLGDDPRRVIRHARRRVEREGPLMSRDLPAGATGPRGWWDWKREKAGLEYLWWTGEVSIARRVHFQKVYDLTERVLPGRLEGPMPSHGEWLDRTCRSAIARLGVATPAEVGAYWGAVQLADARSWCRDAAARGELVPVRVERKGGGRPVPAFAPADFEARLAACPAPPPRTRLLSPFDPVVRDRKRLRRLFGFDYRFEAFTPEAKRRFGYYVLPALEGERFVGRADLKHDRDAGLLIARKVFLEPGVPLTKTRRRGLEAAVARLARQVGAADWQTP